jgi:hypothetical protein
MPEGAKKRRSVVPRSEGELERREMDDRKSERPNRTDEVGEPVPRDPAEGRGAPGQGTADRKGDEDARTRQRLNETSADTRALHRIDDWCRHFLHQPLGDQQRALTQKLRGHYGYYGITGNSHALTRFLWEVKHRWRRRLARRSQLGRLSWEKFEKILDRFPLPRPIAVHSVLRLGAKP